jgi:hypothetical protein
MHLHDAAEGAAQGLHGALDDLFVVSLRIGLDEYLLDEGRLCGHHVVEPCNTVDGRERESLGKILRRVAVVGTDVDHLANGAAFQSQKASPVRGVWARTGDSRHKGPIARSAPR